MWGIAAIAAIVVSIIVVKYTRYDDVTPPLTTVLNASYDYIIVGAGSAGRVLASRLSENPDVTVLLLEAGGDDRGDERISVPAFAPFLRRSDRDWDYTTTTQKHGMEGFIDRKLFVPAGRVLGGSSSTNYMLYVRGHPHDYDQWAAEGCEGWSYVNVLPYFKKSENAQDMPNLKPDIYYHGTEGPLKVSRAGSGEGLSGILIQAAKELGFNFIDSNAYTREGVTSAQITADNGERYSTSRAFLHPVLHRHNLHVVVDTYVTKVLLEGKRAVGVELVRSYRKQVVGARREVIVSAGAIGSPKLLLLSGIGPKQHLQQMGIPMKADLPVGENLHDHLLMDYAVGLKHALGSTPADFTSLWTYAQLKLFGSGRLSHFGEEVQLFVSTTDASRQAEWPDVQILTLDALWSIDTLRHLGQTEEVIHETKKRGATHYGFTCMPVLLRPQSRGTLRLQSSDPFDAPLIDPNYFSHPGDCDTLVRGIRMCERLMQTPSLQADGATDVNDASHACGGQQAYKTDDYWKCVARRNAKSVYHQVGTCKMGRASDDAAVVDPQLRVRGFQNLRVVDASTFPTIPSGNTNAAVIMMAEKAADMIRQ